MNTTALRHLLTRPITIVAAVAIALGAVTTTAFALVHHNRFDTRVPHSAAMEDRLGIRVSRLAVVGDRGLVELSFVVLDTEKATRFEASLGSPPVIVSESRSARTARISVMKQGHNLLPGQTYYLVYDNYGGVLHSHEHATIRSGSLELQHVPVL